MDKKDLVLIAGPCVIESEENAYFLASEIKKIVQKYDFNFYFKASWDKANRTKAINYRGPGLKEGLRILERIKRELHVKIATDIHEPWQAAPVAEVADIIQIPAFLCRQTDLLNAAAKTGKLINVKKAQFMSPEEMSNVVEKLEYFQNRNFMLCERGTCFGYNNLIVDMAGLVRLAKFGYPVIFDATHSVQISGGGFNYGNSGKREYVPYLAKAAMATGVIDGLFMEVHNDPDNALCDGSCMLRLDMLDLLLQQLIDINKINQKYTCLGECE
ncbi:3-deoxy-8-phosphooctulonate synthase [Flavonifractor sp. An306]|uniref:3-deoxy-8-phosphooctulonate synthase n=1 Tax=Flavonifractor sp. An306 TaxID=1965629 RepID=UPI000B381D9F|nr:3-deoxy-8-phosphooctulonate synthase [Flavonifractor sp. An306]OUO38220.1 3-deoxy-8-phosphooctulonate synthase [Flavonifractor sp. An306]